MSKIKYVSSSGLTHYDEKIKKVIDEVDTSTNTKVTQTPTSTDASYPLLLSPSGQTQETNTTSYFNSGVVLNPSTKTISANIDGNAKTATKATSADSATKATQDGDGNVITDTYASQSTNASSNIFKLKKPDYLGILAYANYGGTNYTITSDAFTGINYGGYAWDFDTIIGETYTITLSNPTYKKMFVGNSEPTANGTKSLTFTATSAVTKLGILYAYNGADSPTTKIQINVGSKSLEYQKYKGGSNAHLTNVIGTINTNVNANLNNTLKSDGYKSTSTNQILNVFRMHYGYAESDTIYMLVTAIAGDNEEYRNVTLFAYKYNEYPTKVRTIKNIGMSITARNEIGTVAYSVQTNIKISAIVLQRDLFYSLYDLADTYAKKSIYGDDEINLGRMGSIGSGSVTLGNELYATAINSMAVNGHNTASGSYSFAGGLRNTALTNQFVIGHVNNKTTATENSVSGTSTGTAFAIGNGIHNYSSTNPNASNAFRVTGEGYTIAKNAYSTSGADYAEYFEWIDGNVDKEDRRGLFVTLDGDKIKVANSDDYILGVVSALPSVIGNFDEEWMGRYILDDFGAFITETFEYEDEVTTGYTENGEPIVETVTKTGTKWKENPEYDTTKEYIPRAKRLEWSAIGMLGALNVVDDGTCVVNGYCKCTDGGIATACEKGEGAYRVIKRVTSNIVKVVLK